VSSAGTGSAWSSRPATTWTCATGCAAAPGRQHQFSPSPNLGVGYLKLDYNITVGPGTDTGGLNVGAGMLEHNRAHLAWLDRVLDRQSG